MKSLLINNLEFAKKNQEINGLLEITNCERLAEITSKTGENVANIRYKLTGSAEKMNLPSLHLQIEAQLPVLCQRCLEGMQLNFSLEFDYLISDKELSESEENEENEDVDWLEASQELNLIELIEDELLIAIPIAPMHDSSCLQANLQSGEKPNPFAVLKGRFK